MPLARVVRGALPLALVLLSLGAQAEELDPTVLHPDNYKIFLENDRVRVMDFRLARGATEKMHMHPAHVLYVLEGFKIRFTLPDGSTRMREAKAGDVLFSEAVMHSPVNVGDSDAHGILVELKGVTRAVKPADVEGLLTAVTFVRGKEGKEQELRDELLALSAPTRAEEGNLGYDLYQSTIRPNEFMRFEVWKGAEALEAHKATPHLQRSFETRKQQGWTTEITTWRRVDEGAFPRIVRADPRFDRIVPRDAVLEKVVDGFSWVEGPLWSARGRYLLFSDIPNNAIMRWNEGDAGASVFLKPSGYTGKEPFTGREPGSNGLTFDPRGRLVMAEHGDRRITRLEANGKKTVLADRYQGKRLNSPNDVVFKSNGDMYFTDPPFGLPRGADDPGKELPWNGVYKRSKDGELTLLVKDLTHPNGIAFSPDEKTLYVSNAAKDHAVWMAYPVKADGTLGAGRVFFDATAWARTRSGIPDGMKVDREGNLFAAGPGGIHVFAPDGTLLGSFMTGGLMSNCNWGGDDGSVLYMTADKAMVRVRTTTVGAVRR